MAYKPSTDARDHAGPTRTGNALRDAAVDPQPGDFLPPTNAGKADPHGPLVVAPEIHDSGGPKGIRPGPVAVDDTARQQADETDFATRVLVDSQDVGEAARAVAEPVSGSMPNKAPRPSRKEK